MYLDGFPDVEELRQRFNPAQANLISAHVTLCREDEVQDWCALEQQLRAIGPIELTIEFGMPIREDNLVLLPCVGSTAQFDDLRRQLLLHTGREPRKHLPHVTLIHPRSGVCTDDIFKQITASSAPFGVSFREVSLIEQRDGGPWYRLAVGAGQEAGGQRRCRCSAQRG